MKKIIITVVLFAYFIGFTQNGAPATYYNGFNWTLNGMALKTALATKITTTHTRLLEYFETENAIQVVDRDPADAINVFLIYGFSNSICTYTSETDYGVFPNWSEHRKRHREADQPASPPLSECVWNREHIYALSLGTPDLVTGTPGPGTDAHHVRAADVDRNALRGSRKYAAGSGNSAIVGANWYPGDEWKGDIARMMMYMYLRYPTQCLPKNVGTGAAVTTDTNMIQLFLQWNAEDPVSQYEDNRNTYLGNASNFYGQGNRNPFIDNPYLATRIWGGPAAQNRWPTVLGNKNFEYESSIAIFPNPTTDNGVTINSSIPWNEIVITNLNGQVTNRIHKPQFINDQIQISGLNRGFYFITLNNDETTVTKKLIVNSR